jgi:hypothetical protein
LNVRRLFPSGVNNGYAVILGGSLVINTPWEVLSILETYWDHLKLRKRAVFLDTDNVSPIT